MSVLSDLIEVLRSSDGEKSGAFLAALLAILIGAGLFAYYLSWTPATVEGYYQTNISYSKCYSEGEPAERIILGDGAKRYTMYSYLWRDKYDAATVVDQLKQDSQATVWLSSKEGTIIKGISTGSFVVSPAAGVAWDRSNRTALRWLAVSLLILGVVTLIASLAP